MKSVIAALGKQIEELTLKANEATSNRIAVEERVKQLEEKRIAPVSYENTEEYIALNARIAEIEAKIADEGKCTSEAVNSVEAKIRTTKDAIRDEQDKKMQLTMAENQRRRITELEEQEKRLNAEYEDIEKGIYLCDLFTKAKVAALTDRINGKFKSVRFRLFQEQLNGGLKEDCEVMIPTADGRMVPYTFANNAARINALGLVYRPVRNYDRHWKDDEIETLLTMRAKGHCWEKIGRKLNRSGSAVRGKYERLQNPEYCKRYYQRQRDTLQEYFQKEQCIHYNKVPVAEYD